LHDFKWWKLKLVNQYIIPFTGLKEGAHEFKFNFNEQFFNKYEVLEADGGKVIAFVVLIKNTNMMKLDILLKGTLNIQCDRCLESFDYQIYHTGSIVIKFGESVEESTDEIWVLHPNEHEINLEQYFFECISLSLPIQRMHPEDNHGNSGCNTEMLNILNKHNLAVSEIKKEHDPRWDNLKKLLNNT